MQNSRSTLFVWNHAIPSSITQFFLVSTFVCAMFLYFALDALERGSSSKRKRGEVVKQKIMNGICKDRDVVIQEICNGIYGNVLPFNLVRSLLFVQMLKVVREYDKGLKPPTYNEVIVSFLKKMIR
ncbi:hypothetical protein CR513_41818, partial [Mucuna pruriens]